MTHYKSMSHNVLIECSVAFDISTAFNNTEIEKKLGF